MSLYLVQGSYTPEAVAAQIANPQDRIEILRPIVEKAGGRILAAGFLINPPGIVVIEDWPDDVTANAASLTVFGAGAFTDATSVRLLDSGEWVQVLAAAQGAAGEYTPPGQT